MRRSVKGITEIAEKCIAANGADYDSCVENLSTKTIYEKAVAPTPSFIDNRRNNRSKPVLNKPLTPPKDWLEWSMEERMDWINNKTKAEATTTEEKPEFEIKNFVIEDEPKEIPINSINYGLANLQYRSDEEKPPVNQNYLRLYGHPMDQNTQVVQMIYAAKQVPYQFVEMDMSYIANWHRNANDGALPLLETCDGELIINAKFTEKLSEQLESDGGMDLWPHSKEKEAVDAKIQHKVTKGEFDNCFKPIINKVLDT